MFLSCLSIISASISLIYYLELVILKSCIFKYNTICATLCVRKSVLLLLISLSPQRKCYFGPTVSLCNIMYCQLCRDEFFGVLNLRKSLFEFAILDLPLPKPKRRRSSQPFMVKLCWNIVVNWLVLKFSWIFS